MTSTEGIMAELTTQETYTDSKTGKPGTRKWHYYHNDCWQQELAKLSSADEKPSQELISNRNRMFAMAKEAGVPESELDEFKKQAFELSRLNYIEHSKDYTPKHWDAIYLLLNKKHLITLALDKGIAKDDLLDFCKAWFTEKKMPVKDTYNQFTQQHWDMLFNTLQGMESVPANVGAEDTPSEPEPEQAGEGKA
jgi:hypothetical protein